jgi:hypothetical protein
MRYASSFQLFSFDAFSSSPIRVGPVPTGSLSTKPYTDADDGLLLVIFP